MEWAIQKATEVGVAAIHPLSGERAETPPPTPARLERWRRIALAACKQCGRRTVPRIEPFEALPAPGPGVVALLLDTGPSPRPITERIEASGGGAVWLAVGPEGGFSAGETARSVENGWLASGLGPRTLRAETAGVVAAAIVLNLRGDLGSGAVSG
jgi:16S rRNA (uracil1498-N3)-methyltransferase